MNRPHQTASKRSEFADGLRKGLLIGAVVLAVVLPPMLRVAPPADAPKVAASGSGAPVAPAPQAAAPAGTAPPPSPPVVAQSTRPPAPAAYSSPSAPAAQSAPPAPAAPRLADFAGGKPSNDVRRMANWVVQSGDHRRMAFVIVDKKDAKVYAFDPRGRLQSVVPALLGSARGDHTVPGIGDKPIAQVLPEERTTPAGRFVAEMGMSSSRGEDVVWVDYDAAVSMHRVLKVPERLRALASPTRQDNRMSYGCINLPDSFYEGVLRPLVRSTGAVIYVLPETRPLGEVFASFRDVAAPVEVVHY